MLHKKSREWCAKFDHGQKHTQGPVMRIPFDAFKNDAMEITAMCTDSKVLTACKEI